MAELDRVLKKYTDPLEGGIHGATFVAVDRNTIYSKSFGSRTVDGLDRLTPDTLTWTASLSKLATAVAVMQVVENGLIGLDDDVRNFVPKLKDLKVLIGWEGDEEGGLEPNMGVFNQGDYPELHKQSKPKGSPIMEEIKGKITLRHLLTNSSGFCYDLTSPLVTKWSAWVSRKENMFSGKIGFPHPLIYQPGTSWQYGCGIDWAGQVVEAVTSLSLEAYMQKNIWQPLGCANTTFLPVEHFQAIPPLHETAEYDPSKPLSRVNSIWSTDKQDAIGGAGLYSTANDYSRLLAALLHGGNPILMQKSVDELFSPQLASDSLSLVALRQFMLQGGEGSLSNIWRSPQPATSDKSEMSIDINHTLGGTVVLSDIPGRRRSGTLNFAGLPNLFWWIDRETGVAATLFTQVMPSNNSFCINLAVELETELYKILLG
ncbi:hypothetical protein N7456_008032 [Penicillium angulare]|uniref:Beta-lactamase-related domain-containing protein n=1 Tax=Penicillium angulare TaxID=116970 RepID=A0A9W9FBR5_9EURO|nr:hypothetical protein N7456_008032 [Penicillium angulare]